MIEKKQRERDIERRVKEYGRKTGWFVSKWSSPALRGVPDDIFIKNGRVIFIEFKATGKKPTKLQAAMHKKMEAAGAKVYVIDSVLEGKLLLDFWSNEEKLC